MGPRCDSDAPPSALSRNAAFTRSETSEGCVPRTPAGVVGPCFRTLLSRHSDFRQTCPSRRSRNPCAEHPERCWPRPCTSRERMPTVSLAQSDSSFGSSVLGVSHLAYRGGKRIWRESSSSLSIGMCSARYRDSSRGTETISRHLHTAEPHFKQRAMTRSHARPGSPHHAHAVHRRERHGHSRRMLAPGNGLVAARRHGPPPRNSCTELASTDPCVRFVLRQRVGHAGFSCAEIPLIPRSRLIATRLSVVR